MPKALQFGADMWLRAPNILWYYTFDNNINKNKVKA